MIKSRLIIALALIISVITPPALANADVNNFVITNFESDQTLSRADPQGELHIVEKINVLFSDNNHGLLRAIPDKYKKHSLQIKVNSISSTTYAPSQYTTYSSNGNTVLKIGDPDRTVTGAQEYTIDYTVRNVIGFNKSQSELYWDVNGDQWSQYFQKVSVVLHLPSDLKQNQKPLCFTGSYGTKASNCTISSGDQTIRSATTQPLSPAQTLTYVAGFESGYFTPSKWTDTVGEYAKQLIQFFAPIILIGGGSALYWWMRGRDPRGSGVIVPQYEAPEGIKPVSVGTIMDFKLDNKDITATIIDLAVRGYIKIVETKQVKTLQKDKLSYNLELVNADFSKLNSDEIQLMGGLFESKPAGTIIDISAMKTKLYTTASSLNKTVLTSLTTAGYFRSNPLNAGKSMITLFTFVAIGLIYGGWQLVGVSGAVGLVVAAAIAIIAGFASPARTVKGVAAKEQIEGLKMYLEVAEKDRIKKLQGPDATYASNAKEPVKTVDLFEKLLPFAMVLGVEKQWAGKFEGLYNTPPSWYSGNWTTFNAAYLASSLHSGIGSAVNSAFTAPSSSGGSGFGGGGFSGGGGGGGGGGGW